jgi:hypothetical protein
LSSPGYIGAGSNYDSSVWPHPDDIDDPQFAWTTTQDDLPGETRGLTEIELENWGEENVLVVTLVEYPEDYSGENPVCVEIGKKQFEEEPEYPVSEVKTPQIRWAGEKIVLEKDWTDVLDNIQWDCRQGDLIAVYHLDQESVGTLYPAGDNAFREFDGGDIWVKVAGCSPGPSNPVSEVILETEFQGKSDVEVALYRGMWGSPPPGSQIPIIWPGRPIVNTGFMVFFLAIEEIEWDFERSSDLVNLQPRVMSGTPVIEGDPAHLALQVKGYFTNDQLGPAPDPDNEVPSPRPAEWLNCDNIGGPERLLPEGRWVLPDDWARLAGATNALPNWDLMDMADLDDIQSTSELGPYSGVLTTDPPGAAQSPNIGPFNTLQKWSRVDMWITEATVPSSQPTSFVRNTVIPDGTTNWFDAPMPQALVQFEIVDDTTGDAALSGLDKGMLQGYGKIMDGSTTYYPSPFYAVEIPSSIFITPAGYNYDSWIIDAPYQYWMDLELDSIISNTSENPVDDSDVEVYTDNHGFAAVQIDPLHESGTVEVEATVRFPNSLTAGQYCGLTSDGITATWGNVEFDPDFIGQPRFCADLETCFVTFTNYTTGGVLPYTRAVWDFGDGTTPWEGAINRLDTTDPHQYTAEGIYDVTVTMWDSAIITQEAFQTEIKYILVVEGSGPVVPTTTWTFTAPGCFPQHLPDSYTGEVETAGLEDVPAEVQGVYYYDSGTDTWLFWAPGAPNTNLDKLLGGTAANYMVCATGATTWEIPLTP